MINESYPGAAVPIAADKEGLSGRLGVGAIVMMVVATASPLAVMVANLPLIILMGNGPAAPFDALVAMAIMLLFTVGFVAMARYIKNSGAFYAFIQKGLGRVVGLGSATLALTSYFLILVAIEGYFGYLLASTAQNLIGVNLPWQLLSFAVVAVVGYLGYRHIELSAKALGVALILEILIVLAVNFSVLLTNGAASLDIAVFSIEAIGSGSPGLGIMFAIYCFIGFEATVVFREEARDPDRTIPLATYVAVIGVGVFYFVSMWCLVSAVGVDNVVSFTTEHPGDMYLLATQQFLGKASMDVMQLLLVTSLFACVLSLHNIVVRYKYVLGSYGVFPRRLSSIHPLHGSPHSASLVQTVCSAVVLAIVMAMGLDPVTQLYAWGATAGTLGYLVILSLTCVSIIVFFSRNGNEATIWQRLIAPTGALIGILFCIWIAVDNLPALIGGDNAGFAAYVIEVIVAVAFVVGLMAALLFRSLSPARYHALAELA